MPIPTNGNYERRNDDKHCAMARIIARRAPNIVRGVTINARRVSIIVRRTPIVARGYLSSPEGKQHCQLACNIARRAPTSARRITGDRHATWGDQCSDKFSNEREAQEALASGAEPMMRSQRFEEPTIRRLKDSTMSSRRRR